LNYNYNLLKICLGIVNILEAGELIAR